MHTHRDSRLTKIALVLFFVLVIAYAYFESRGVIYGPSINITSDVTVVQDPYITIRGHADHIANLMMDGRQISVTEDGVFEEPFVLSPGDNLIVLEARDKYNRVSRRTVEIVYQKESSNISAPIKNSTSTATSTM